MDQPVDTKTSKKAQTIVAMAEVMFQKYGFKRVTVEEICQKASVSKMTFYKYFDNKEELLKHIIDKWFDDVLSVMTELNALDIPFAEKLRRILRLKEEFITKQSEEFLADYINPGPELQSYFQDFYAKGIMVFIDFIKEAQEKGEVRKQIRPEFLIAILNKLIEAAKDPALVSLYPSMKEYSLEINNFLFYGILPLDKVEHQND